MEEYFKYLVERANYYAMFEFYRDECKQSSSGIEQEWINLEETEKQLEIN